MSLFAVILLRRARRRTPFPYTTLFRSLTETLTEPSFIGGVLVVRHVDVKQHRLVRVQGVRDSRSEEHTSELQSRGHLVCRLLLEKKKAEGREAGPAPSRDPPRRAAALP